MFCLACRRIHLPVTHRFYAMNYTKTFILLNEDILVNAIKYMGEMPSDGEYQVKIEKAVKTKTPAQNRALFAVAYPPLMDYMGMVGNDDKEELHAYFCGEFFGWKEYMLLDKKKIKPIRTTTRNEEGKRDLVNTQVMADLYSFVQMKGAENGVYIPDPDPFYGVKL